MKIPHLSLLLRRRALFTATNEAPVLTRLIDACNIGFDAKAEWSTLKYGVYPNQVGLQVFDREAAQAMVDTFNSLGNRWADAFRGIPGYVGHADDPEWRRHNPGIPASAITRIREMRVGETGLEFRQTLNEDGKRLLTGDAPAYDSYSPRWGMIETTYKGRKAFRPVELYSIGYTNQPNIPGTFIGLNEALPPETSNPMKVQIIALLAALGRPVANAATVTDEQLATAVNEAVPVATKYVGDAGQLATVQTQLTTAQSGLQTATNEAATLRTSLASERAARAGQVITTAINEGRLTEAGRSEWLGKFTATGADFAAVEGELGKLKKAVNTKSQAEIGSRRGQVNPEQKQRITAINEAITAKCKVLGTEDRNAAYLALQREGHELFKNDVTA